MQVNPSLLSKAFFLIVAGVGSMCGGGLCQAQSQETTTAIPVQFIYAMKAGKVKTGEVLKARTMQAVTLSDGTVVPKGSMLSGHIVTSQPFIFNSSPYAAQTPSSLAFSFDKIEEHGASIPIHAEVRALASSISSNEAESPRMDSADFFTTVVQVGGDQWSTSGKELLSSRGDLVGYSRKNGVFAHLASSSYVSPYSHFDCGSTTKEQSVAIFSASACGLYGFDTSTYILDNGSTSDGSIKVESRRHTINLGWGSTALLEVRKM